jgi:osmotically inducible protein OsmC
MQATRRAEVIWKGPLRGGAGTLSAVTSGVFADVPISWPRRIEADAEGHTSPEELLAAAHASCFSMGMSNRLAVNGFPPEQLDVSAEVTIAQPEQWPSVVSSHITVHAVVADIDEDTFQEYARLALQTCPMSRAITGNVELSVSATLARP